MRISRCCQTAFFTRFPCLYKKIAFRSTYCSPVSLRTPSSHQSHQKGQLSFGHGSIPCSKSMIRSSIHPDTTPFPALPSLGSTFVLQTPFSSSNEYCLHSLLPSHRARHSSAEPNSPSSTFSLKFSHPARGAIICGMTRSAKTSLWRRVEETFLINRSIG